MTVPSSDPVERALVCGRLACALVCLFFCGCGAGLPAQVAFDWEVWLDPRVDDGRSQRLAMVEDLLENFLSAGMTRRQVDALLGPSDGGSRGEPGWNLGNMDTFMDTDT